MTTGDTRTPVTAPTVIMPGLSAAPTSRGVTVVSLHYSADPLALVGIEEQERRRLGCKQLADGTWADSWQWRREMELDWLAQSGQPVFDAMALDWQRQHVRPPVLEMAYRIEKDAEGRLRAALFEQAGGPIRVWIRPGEQPAVLPAGTIGVRRSFALGGDVSEGVGASDSAGVVFVADTREQAAEFADNRIEPADFGRVLVAIARYYDDALILPVRPMHGITVLRTILDEQGYGRVWREKTLTGSSPMATERYGWAKGESSSPALFGVWTDEIAHRRVILHSQTLLDQHRQWVYDDRGRITHQALANLPPEVRNRHGDLVVGAALSFRAMCDLPRFADTAKQPYADSSLLAARERWKREAREKDRQSEQRWA